MDIYSVCKTVSNYFEVVIFIDFNICFNILSVKLFIFVVLIIITIIIFIIIIIILLLLLSLPDPFF